MKEHCQADIAEVTQSSNSLKEMLMKTGHVIDSLTLDVQSLEKVILTKAYQGDVDLINERLDDMPSRDEV